MKPNLWKRIEELFHRSLELDSRSRSEFLKEASGGDDRLRSEVESLLAEEETTDHFLETSALQVAAKALAESRTELTGKRLGAYEILSVLGTGGTAVVYKAKHLELGQLRALKVLPPEIASDRTRMRRFRREAKAVAKLNHPNIAKVFEISEETGIHFIALEFVDGMNLATKIADGALPIPEVIHFAMEIARALKHAHSRRILHRDIKPSNLMLTPDNGLKVLDFGLAKVKQAEEESRDQSFSTDTLTQPGVVMGTIGYMSPEQLLGKDLDQRTDIFSLGVVTYNMVTGNLPFAGKTLSDQMDRILNSQPEPLARFNREVPVKLEAIVRKCLQKNFKLRYKSCKKLLADLSDL
jgi:serine/threonine protein kinase